MIRKIPKILASSVLYLITTLLVTIGMGIFWAFLADIQKPWQISGILAIMVAFVGLLFFSKLPVVSKFSILLLVFFGMYSAVSQTPLQTTLAKRSAHWLSQKLGMKVSIGKAELKWFDALTLKDVLIEDLKQRPMIKVEEIDVDFSLKDLDYPKFKLINLDYVLLKKPQVHLVAQNGGLNIDDFINRVNRLIRPKPCKTCPERNLPFTIDEAYLSDAEFKYDDPRMPKFNNGTFEYYHFKLNNISGNVKNFFVMGDTLKFKVENVKALDRHSKLEVKELSTNFFYCEKRMEMNKLMARFDKSTLKNQIIFSFKHPRDLGDFNNKVYINAQLDGTELHTQDLAKFAPVLLPYTDVYHLNTEFEGYVKDFKLKNATIGFGTKSLIAGNMAFKHLPDVLKADMDLNLKKAQVYIEDTRQYVGDQVYEKNLKPLGKVEFVGNFLGRYNDFVSDGDFNSALGRIKGDLKMKWDQDPMKAVYSGNLFADNFMIGKIINKEKIIDKVSLNGKIEGNGFDVQSSDIKFNGTLPNIGLYGYNYNQVLVNGSLSKSIFNGKLGVKDSNLVFNLDGKIDFNSEENAFDIAGKIDRANLKALGFAKTDLKITAGFDVDLSGTTVDNIVGNAKLRNVHLDNDGKKLVIDSLFAVSGLGLANKRSVSINSEFLSANFLGNFQPSMAIRDLARLWSEYEVYFFGNQDARDRYYQTVFRPYLDKYAINYNLKLKRSGPLLAFLGTTIEIAPQSNFEGTFNVASNVQFSIFGQSDSIKIGTAKFYDNQIDLTSFNKVTYDTTGKALPKILTSLIFTSDRQELSSAAPTEKMEISAEWGQGNQIEFFSKIKQQNSPNKARLLGDLYFVSDGIDVKLKADTTKSFVYILNKKWHIHPQNLITISGSEVCFHRLLLSDGIQGVGFDGTLSENPDKTALISVQEFDLRTLKPFFKTFDFEGIVNGQVSLKDAYQNTVMTTDTLTIDEIIYKGEYMGSLVANANWNAKKERLDIATQIQYKSHPVPILSVSGFYDPKDKESSLNLNAVIRNAGMQLAKPFLNDVFYDFKGSFSGRTAILGTLNNPKFDGDLLFKSGKLKVKTIHTALNFDQQKIYLDAKSQKIQFKNFKVTDDAGNEGILNDGIYYFAGGKVAIDLNAKMTNFKILEATQQDIESFYGTAHASGTLEVLGPPDNLLFKAKATSTKGTRIVIPLDGATTVNQNDKFVEFVDYRKKPDPEAITKKEISLSGMRLDFNFNFTPDATCEVILDSKTNDKLIARGRAEDFRVLYDTRGTFTLNGKYLITDGLYDFKFQGIASKKFSVASGSYISWAGNPLDGIIDITALYQDKVSISSIVPSVTDPTIRYPINVVITMRNKLQKPDIGLGLKFIEYPVQDRDQVLAFENRMQIDEQERNRNIASVLVLHQLFPKDPNAIFYSNLIIGNIGEIISNKINDFAAKIDKNLDLGLSVQSVGQNVLENLNLRIGYKINDRLKFSGSGATNSSTANINTANKNLYYGGELEYLLTEDGTWKFKVFSRNMPQNYLGYDRNVVINGVSVQSTRNFNRILKPKKIVYMRREDQPQIVKND